MRSVLWLLESCLAKLRRCSLRKDSVNRGAETLGAVDTVTSEFTHPAAASPTFTSTGRKVPHAFDPTKGLASCAFPKADAGRTASGPTHPPATHSDRRGPILKQWWLF
jgi:hypothetical protein